MSPSILWNSNTDWIWGHYLMLKLNCIYTGNTFNVEVVKWVIHKSALITNLFVIQFMSVKYCLANTKQDGESFHDSGFSECPYLFDVSCMTLITFQTVDMFLRASFLSSCRRVKVTVCLMCDIISAGERFFWRSSK